MLSMNSASSGKHSERVYLNLTALVITKKSTYGVSKNFDKCFNKGTCCTSQTCTVDTYMIEKINEATKGNWKNNPDQSMCFPGPADHQHDSCCGVAPNLFS